MTSANLQSFIVTQNISFPNTHLSLLSVRGSWPLFIESLLSSCMITDKKKADIFIIILDLSRFLKNFSWNIVEEQILLYPC